MPKPIGYSKTVPRGCSQQSMSTLKKWKDLKQPIATFGTRKTRTKQA
jgi:hypothetical protein